MLTGRRLSRVQAYASELHLLLETRDQAEGHQERLRLALITSNPDKWLPIFYPDEYRSASTDRAEVTEEDLESDEGITFEFEEMDGIVAEGLLGQLMADAKAGQVAMSQDGEWR